MAKSLAVARPTSVLPTMTKSTISKCSLHVSFLGSKTRTISFDSRSISGQVRALVQIAPLAGQAEIFQTIVEPMLRRDDMVHVKRCEWLCRLWKLTVLARVVCTLDYDFSRCLVHATVQRSEHAVIWLGAPKSGQ